MHTQRIHEVLAEAIVGRHLLIAPLLSSLGSGHPVGGRAGCVCGAVPAHRAGAPGDAVGHRGRAPARAGHATLVEANLADELGSPEPHAELFESFAEAAGAAPDARATPSTAALLAVVRTTASNDPAAALAMVAAYEVQAADIAAPSPTACAATTGSTRRAPASGTCTARRRSEHAGWSMEALAELGRGPRRRAGRRHRLGRLVVAVPQRARGAGARGRPLSRAFS